MGLFGRLFETSAERAARLECDRADLISFLTKVLRRAGEELGWHVGFVLDCGPSQVKRLRRYVAEVPHDWPMQFLHAHLNALDWRLGARREFSQRPDLNDVAVEGPALEALAQEHAWRTQAISTIREHPECAAAAFALIAPSRADETASLIVSSPSNIREVTRAYGQFWSLTVYRGVPFVPDPRHGYKI